MRFSPGLIHARGNDIYTKILLHMDGANGGATFDDSSVGGSTHSWTAAGGAKTASASPKFGNAALLCNGSSDYIYIPDSSDLTLGSSDFTIDFWFSVSGGSGAYRYICGQANTSGAAIPCFMGLTPSNVFFCGATSNGSSVTYVTGSTSITSAGYHHAAFIRFGNTLKLFLDGVQEGGDVSFSAAIYDSSNIFSVGALGAYASNRWPGYIDEFRLSIGKARWTSNFTPPAMAYS